MEKRHVTISQAVSWAFKAYAGRIMFFLTLSLIYLVQYFVCSTIMPVAIDMLARKLPITNLMLLILVLVFAALLSLLLITCSLGLIKIALDIYDHGKAELKTLFSQWHLAFSACGAYLLLNIAIIFGLAFLIVPGLWIAARYCLSLYVLVDTGNRNIFEAFQESYRLTAGATWQMLGLLCIAVILSFSLLLLPVAVLMFAYAYRKQQEYSRQLPTLRDQ